MKRILAVMVMVCGAVMAQGQAAPVAAADPLQVLAFLEGTWVAQTSAQGSAGATVVGTYTFRRELKGHVLARHGLTQGGCKGPEGFDCEHNDLLYVYADAPGQPLKAIYFDNEGHVLHYDVTTPSPSSVVFLSDASVPGPRFRLTYELKGGVMAGKFQMHMPGPGDWQSYLEWSGGKK